MNPKEPQGPDFSVTVEMIQLASQLFDEMAQSRHEGGVAEYGQFGFLDNDTLTMAMEELVDLANYARYTFIKIAILAGKVQDYQASQVGHVSFTPMGETK